MDLTGEYRIPATRAEVWQALNDPQVLRSCIPGCSELVRAGDTRFEAIVTARVGPVAPTFRGQVDLTDIDEPNGYTLTGRGQGGAAGFAKLSAQVRLEADGDAATVLRYSAQAEVGGKLAAVGSRLVQGVARKTADDFFAALAGRFEPAQFAQAAVADKGRVPTSALELEAESAGLKPLSGSKVTAAFSGGLAAPVPAWLVVFSTALGVALGWCIGLLQH